MPKWIRVRDTQTGHTFDVEERVLEHRRGVEPVNDPERWPDVEGPRAAPRPAKPYVTKDGRPRAAADSGDTGEQGPDAISGGDQPPADGEQVGDRQTRSRRHASKTTSTPPDVPADDSSSKENQR